MALPRYLFLLVEIVSIFGLARGFSSFRLRVPNGDQEIASSKAIGHIHTSEVVRVTTLVAILMALVRYGGKIFVVPTQSSHLYCSRMQAGLTCPFPFL